MAKSSSLSISGLISGLIWMATQGVASGASSLLEDGIRQFNIGEFSTSAQTLGAAVNRQPSSQIGRYYLACALVKTHEHRRAVEEYRIAYLLNPASTTGGYCKAALQGYKAALPDLRDAKRVQEECQRQTAAVAAQAASGEVNRAVGDIRRQLDFEKNKHRTDEQNREKIIRTIAEDQIKQIDQQAAEQIARLSDPIVFSADGARANPLLIYPELLKQREDAIKKAAQEEKERILRALDEKTERYKGIQKSHDSALDEVAANLESQMKNTAKGGVQLQASGTGLYVRNYLSPGSKAPAEVRQAVVRIVDQGSRPYPGNENTSTQPETGLTGKSATRSVTGTLRPAQTLPLPAERVVNGKMILPQ